MHVLHIYHADNCLYFYSTGIDPQAIFMDGLQCSDQLRIGQCNTSSGCPSRNDCRHSNDITIECCKLANYYMIILQYNLQVPRFLGICTFYIGFSAKKMYLIQIHSFFSSNEWMRPVQI